MHLLKVIDNITISPRANRLLSQLMDENPDFASIIRNTVNPAEANKRVYEWVMNWMADGHDKAMEFLQYKISGHEALSRLSWQEIGAIRLLDYINNAGRVFENLNKQIKQSVTDPIRIVWQGYHHGKGGGKPEFYMDMIHLMRQFSENEERQQPSRQQVIKWINRHYAGTDPEIRKIREENKVRILKVIIKQIEEGKVKSASFNFPEDASYKKKMSMAIEWWNDYRFHLKFAIRTPELLNEMLGYSIDPDTLFLLDDAKDAGIPFFVNPYYLSLINVNTPEFARNNDLALRDYMIYSRELIEEFGKIVAWEKEDKIEPGKPNAAGWMLPNDNNVHRRYPEVAILIPDTVGRACGGLCVSCQRMYDFQKGRLNFNLEKLEQEETWEDKLLWLMKYFEEDSQLRDILITGGDALMSSDKSLKEVLDAVYDMAVRKRESNKKRPEGKKYAEMIRVRLGTRLPVYIPQRINDDLIKVLSEFREKASAIGFKQFIIQTHFVSPMEVTDESAEAVRKLIDAGWMVHNQMVFTAAASRRGFAAKLRQTLNDIGVLPYYTFSVKGFMENYHNFATNERAIQEQIEEKSLGHLPEEEFDYLTRMHQNGRDITEAINSIREKHDLPFLATDRNVLNLPGVGKSLTFRTIGITRRGRRILEFEHDTNRTHSPITKKMGRVNIIESKPILNYLQQLEDMGEDITEYKDIWGYSIGETEARPPVFEYPEYDFEITPKMTNLKVTGIPKE
ncbi:MAG: KamA family radical SAM protein [Bacteroidales bacterium]